jgi:haloalkane dehalogenase
VSDREETTRAGSAEVHWWRSGAGPAAVFLHGFPLSGRTWEGVIARLRDRYTCYAPDLIGLGGSRSAADDDHASPGQARVMQGLLTTLGVASYVLVGNDTGGWVARELALLDGARVTGLVLTNTEIPLHRPPWIPTYQALARLPGFAHALRVLLGSRTFRRSPLGFGGCFADLDRLDGPFHDRVVAPLLASAERRERALRFLRCMRFTRLDELRTLHREIAAPTRFVWGADDPTFPEAHARAMVAQFARPAGFTSVPRGKLFFYEEQPDALAREIAGFCVDIGAGGRTVSHA